MKMFMLHNINRLNALDGSAERVHYLKINNLSDLYYTAVHSHLNLIIKCYRRFENNSDVDKSVLTNLRTKFSKELKQFRIFKTIPLRRKLYFGLFYLNPKLHKLVLSVWVVSKTKRLLKLKLLIKEKIKYYVLSGIYIIVKILRGLRIIKHKKIWLIGGASGRAYTDNSAALHSYLISRHPELHVYWVANKNCKDLEKIINKGPVIFKSTIKLLIYIALAEVLIVSHSKSDIYSYNYKMVDNIFKVHLGHGANTFKKKEMRGKNKTLNEDFDLFIANSEYEKNTKTTWDIDSEKIIITGMPRHDELLRKSLVKEKNRKKVILYMPTWREWLDNDKIEYERFNRELSNFAQNEKLIEILKRHGYKICMYLHINLHKYYERIISDNNSSHFIKLPLSIDLQSYIASSDLLITDYSSVAWDFILLNKPVIFYQFDLNLFELHRGSYIDMRNDLFGPSVYNLQDLTKVLSEHLENNTIIIDYKAKMSKWKNKMFLYNDDENCKRVVGEINSRLRKQQQKLGINKK